MNARRKATDSNRRARSGDRAALGRLIRPYRGQLGAIAVPSVLGGFAEAAALLLVVQAAVAMSGDRAVSIHVGPVRVGDIGIVSTLLLALVFTAARVGAALLAAWSSARLASDVQRDLRIATFGPFLDANWSLQSQEREGGLQQLVAVEVERAAVAAFMVATSLSNAANLVTLLLSAVLVSAAAGGALIVAVGVLFFVLRPVTRRSRRHARERSRGELNMAHSLSELVRTAEEIRVYGVGNREKDRLVQETNTVSHWITRLYFVTLSVSTMYQGMAIALLVGALLLVDVVGHENLADVGVIVLLLLRAFAYSQQLQQAYHQLGERLPSLALIEERQALYNASPAKFGDASLDRIDSIDLDNVSFSYAGRDRALIDVSVHVDRGQVVGVVGSSGAGKSTLIQILLQLRSPASGTYLVNGMAADQFRADDWSRRVSYLSQDPKLIAGSVTENICFRRDATTEQIVAAAKLANVHDDVMLLPDGYDTVLALGSAGVSGGQRQRICLARALVMRPDLLILDEPTSALDARSEQLVRDSLSSLRGDMTLVIIAHKLPTLSICDHILVMREGHVDAFDTPEALAASDGFYRDALRLSRL